jgi:hypothetical protein
MTQLRNENKIKIDNSKLVNFNLNFRNFKAFKFKIIDPFSQVPTEREHEILEKLCSATRLSNSGVITHPNVMIYYGFFVTPSYYCLITEYFPVNIINFLYMYNL